MATLHRQFRFHSSLFLWDFVWKLGKNSVKKQQPGTLWRSPEDSVERKWKLGKTKKKKRKKWRSRKAKQINGGTGSVDGFQIFVMTIKKAERLHFCLLFARWFLFYGGDSFDDFFFPFFLVLTRVPTEFQNGESQNVASTGQKKTRSKFQKPIHPRLITRKTQLNSVKTR